MLFSSDIPRGVLPISAYTTYTNSTNNRLQVSGCVGWKTLDHKGPPKSVKSLMLFEISLYSLLPLSLSFKLLMFPSSPVHQISLTQLNPGYPWVCQFSHQIFFISIIYDISDFSSNGFEFVMPRLKMIIIQRFKDIRYRSSQRFIILWEFLYFICRMTGILHKTLNFISGPFSQSENSSILFKLNFKST